MTSFLTGFKWKYERLHLVSKDAGVIKKNFKYVVLMLLFADNKSTGPLPSHMLGFWSFCKGRRFFSQDVTDFISISISCF